jgi:hypothetical protein
MRWALLALAACGTSPAPANDAGSSPDVGAAALDSGAAVDAGSWSDAGIEPDVGPGLDAALLDAAFFLDAAATDAESPDAESPDAGAALDASAPDAGDFDGGFFDPVVPANITQAFTTAKAEAAKFVPGQAVSFVEVVGDPTAIGPTFEAVAFQWTYSFAAGSNVVKVVHPGWTSSHKSGLPMGAYLDEASFAKTVPLSLEQIFGKAAASGVDDQTCKMQPGAKPPAFIDLRGTLGKTGSFWFWEFSCGGSMGLVSFDPSGNKL